MATEKQSSRFDCRKCLNQHGCKKCTFCISKPLINAAVCGALSVKYTVFNPIQLSLYQSNNKIVVFTFDEKCKAI